MWGFPLSTSHIDHQYYHPCFDLLLPQKHEEEQRLADLQRQLQELERAEHKLTTEAEELGLDAAEVGGIQRLICTPNGLMVWGSAS